MIDEIKEVWEYDPILIDWQAILIFAFIAIYVSLTLYVMINHGHVFSMGNETYFDPGHFANGDRYPYHLL
jgi:hypothetical protein